LTEDVRGTTDYWVNAMDGRPFFVVSCAVDPGLLSVLGEQIVPRLKADVPNQPTEEQLEDDPLLSRFTIVFDREGYSPGFFAQMKEERIAILTYHRFPGELWPEQEFRTHLIGFTKTLSIELGEFGVRANAILPGAVDGPRIQRVFEGRAKASGQALEEIKKQAMAVQSLGRFVDPRDIAALAVFLASDAVKSISGQMLPEDSYPFDVRLALPKLAWTDATTHCDDRM